MGVSLFSASLHHLHRKPNKWQELRPAVPSFLIVSSFPCAPPLHPPPHPPPPSPALPTPLAFIPLPSSVHPSLSLPGACLSGSVPVCLFADDSTWSRCDAQQLLLCSITLPCHLARSALAASLPPSLPLPPIKCLSNALIYVPFLFCFFFAATPSLSC